MNWEDTFRGWAEPPSQTEIDKCENTVRAIKNAINNNSELSEMNISIFPQGSYRARTNVKHNSDVDVCVCLNTTFFADYPTGKSKEFYGNVDANIGFLEYKNLIENALVDYFGYNSVKRGNKAFDIHENTYRIDADVVAAFTHRRYYKNETNEWITPEGIAFKTDDNSSLIKNWPEQTYENGVNKNSSTGKRYKSVVRILKRLRDKMQDERIEEAKDIASFLIESLVWNVPNNKFGNTYIQDDVKEVLRHIYQITSNTENCKELGEVNELKYLFRMSQPWTREQANVFVSKVWDYLGY